MSFRPEKVARSRTIFGVEEPAFWGGNRRPSETRIISLATQRLRAGLNCAAPPELNL